MKDVLTGYHARIQNTWTPTNGNANDVAMLLIDENGAVHVNEMACQRLQTLWSDAYSENMKKIDTRYG